MRGCRFENRQRCAETNIGVQDVGRIQPEPLFNNFLPTPPFASNCMVIMAHVMVSGASGASFVMSSDL